MTKPPQKTPGTRGFDRRPRRRRLPPDIAAELSMRLSDIVDGIADTVGELPHRPLREVITGIEDSVVELSDHVMRCRELLDA